MKRLIIISIMLLGLALTAGAQVRFGIQGDVTNLNVGGPAKDIYGLGVGGGIHFDVSLGPLGFRLSGDYVTLSPDKGKYQALLATVLPGSVASQFTIEGARINVISGNANLKFDILPLPIIHAYITGGGGLVSMSVTDAEVKFNGTAVGTVPGMKSQTKPSVNAGAGADISLGGVTLYGEVKIVWIMTEGETSTQVPLATVGLTF